MSIAELLPIVHSLSRRDKFRLIQILAEDLATSEDIAADVDGGIVVGTTGTSEAKSNSEAARPTNLANFEQLWTYLIETGQSLPVRFPDESYEAAAILMRMLETEKAAS